jgi:hypothetical protein
MKPRRREQAVPAGVDQEADSKVRPANRRPPPNVRQARRIEPNPPAASTWSDEVREFLEDADYGNI